MENNINKRHKSFTSLEQSKKLAEILPLETADCYWDYDEMQKFHRISWFEDGYNKESQLRLNENNVCAWSLAALLEVLNKKAHSLDEDGAICSSSYKGIEWDLSMQNTDLDLDLVTKSNPVDACVAMIEKLHEQKLL